MDRNIISNNRCKFSNLFFNEIIPGHIERYDASKLLCWYFCGSADDRHGIELKLGNQIIIAFLDSKNYEDAIRLAISMGGDADSNSVLLK